jgi:hypothetical protein
MRKPFDRLHRGVRTDCRHRYAAAGESKHLSLVAGAGLRRWHMGGCDPCVRFSRPIPRSAVLVREAQGAGKVPQRSRLLLTGTLFGL